MSSKKIPPEALEFFKRAGSRGGKRGGKARMSELTAAERSELARKAAAARWKKSKKRARG